eukprot:535158_1
MERAKTNKYNGKYILVDMNCPHCNKDSTNGQWYHKNCYQKDGNGNYSKSKMWINEYAYTRCDDWDGYPFVDWKWCCPVNNGVPYDADKGYAAKACMALLTVSKLPDDLDWIDEITSCLSKQCYVHHYLIYIFVN